MNHGPFFGIWPRNYETQWKAKMVPGPPPFTGLSIPPLFFVVRIGWAERLSVLLTSSLHFNTFSPPFPVGSWSHCSRLPGIERRCTCNGPPTSESTSHSRAGSHAMRFCWASRFVKSCSDLQVPLLSSMRALVEETESSIFGSASKNQEYPGRQIQASIHYQLQCLCVGVLVDCKQRSKNCSIRAGLFPYL